MKIFLSIDIDFWNYLFLRRDWRQPLPPQAFRPMKFFFTSVAKTGIKPFIMDSHETMLDYVNDSDADSLINVDFHADLTNSINDPNDRRCETIDFNCGTWINYVKFAKTGHFTWIHPHNELDIDYGLCHYPRDRKHDPFKNPKLCEWRSIKEMTSKTPENDISWGNVVAIGVAFSYAWVRSSQIADVAEKLLGYRPKENKHAKL